ncbi:hypothetical protein G9A89_012879 [Geosiphon pyriformis]|nr:hypothetical protein G9A89_012879 [Geosiphon pyriformis]
MEKAVKVSGFNNGFRPVFSRKKRRETGNTTKSNSIDIEEECLVEKTSFDYGENNAFAGRDPNQIPIGSKVKTKKVLDKLLGKINFLLSNNKNDVFLDAPLELPPPLKNLVNISVCKFFALDIGLDKVLFSKINGFGKASTLLKFAGIIRATFTSELSLVQASKKAEETKILVNTNLKKFTRQSNQAVVVKEIPIGILAETVCAVLFEFGTIMKTVVEFKQLDYANLVAGKWSILIKKDAIYVDFIGAINEKTCIINHYLITYTQTRCTVICFDSAESLNAIIKTILVLRDVNLCWSYLVLAECTKYEKSGHMSISCAVGGKVSFGVPLHKVLLDMDKSRLAAIYAKCLALVACPVKVAGRSSFYLLSSHSVLAKIGSFLEMKLFLLVMIKVNNRFATLEHSLASLVEQVKADVVMNEDSGVFTSDKTVVGMMLFNISSVSKLKDSMKCLMETVLGLSAKVDSLGAVATCNVKGINNPVKQDDIICWHKDMNNLISIVTKTKLKDKWCLGFYFWFGFWLYGSGVAIIINIFLVQHVCKVSKIPGRLLSIKLLFKNKLSMSILGLYTGASSVVWFFQAGEINSFIAKTVNESSFIILGRDFNEDSLRKCASFKKYLNLELVNSLLGKNSRYVKKTINYVLVSFNLVNAVLECTISVLVGLGGLLDVQLNSLSNTGMFSDEFAATVKFSDLDVMWNHFDSVFTKVFSRFHKLELLVSKIIKTSYKNSVVSFVSLMKCWNSLNSIKVSVVQDLINSGVNYNCVYSALSDIKKLYCASKLAKSLVAKKTNIRAAIEKKMESFKINKGHTIRSVLEHSFYKVVLNHLVVDDKLILEPNSVKSKVDIIMENWTRKHNVVADVSDDWFHQYWLLDYVFDEVFFGILCLVEFSELFDVVSNLPDGKAAGLLGITNELWKHCDKSILDMFLAWVSMILKPYKWESVLMNTYPIALIEMACNILSKILSDKIFLACSTFDSPIFAIESVVEDALEKNWELWLVLQNM